VGDDQILTIT